MKPPAPASHEPQAEEEEERPARRLTLFERMMDMARRPKSTDDTPTTLAPEPEAATEDRDESTVIPPFFKSQRN